MTTSNDLCCVSDLCVATRLHLGKASAPPSNESYKFLLQQYLEFVQSIRVKPQNVYIAVDATPKFKNYHLVDTLQQILVEISSSPKEEEEEEKSSIQISQYARYVQLIPVTPWGNFCPALNAIILTVVGSSQAAQESSLSNSDNLPHRFILMVSAETKASPALIHKMASQFSTTTSDATSFVSASDTLVVGAVLPGHAYVPQSIQPLTGRTTPWNTLAIWNLNLLALTGFPLVADGLHVIPQMNNNANNDDKQTSKTWKRVSSGVEEVSTIALLQRILGPKRAKAKLTKQDDVAVEWNQTFDNDPERLKWHQAKMKSKVERPAVHLKLLGLYPDDNNNDGVGQVEHL